MPIPSNLTNVFPSDDPQGFMRRIEAIEADVRRVPALVQEMVGPQIAKISAQLDAINKIIDEQVDIGSVGKSSTGFTPTSTATNYAVSNITVPDGYTRAIVLAAVDATAEGSGGVGYLELQAVIAGTAGGSARQSPNVNTYLASASASAIRTLTGLAGGTISVGARISANGTWTSASSIANCNAIAVFLR